MEFSSGGGSAALMRLRFLSFLEEPDGFVWSLSCLFLFFFSGSKQQLCLDFLFVVVNPLGFLWTSHQLSPVPSFS